MTTERRASSGPSARRATHRLALIALAVAAIGLEGCQSIQSINPFRNCGGCGPLSRIGNGGGLFNRSRGQIIYDEPPIIVDSAPGVEVLTPESPVIIDSGPPMGGSTLSPSEPAFSDPYPSVRPPAEDETLDLSPLPEPSGRNTSNDGPRVSSNRTTGSRPIDRTSGQAGPPPLLNDPYADRMARRSSDETEARSRPDPAPGPGRADPTPVGGASLSVFDSLPSPESISINLPEDSAPAPPAVSPEPAEEGGPAPPAVAAPEPEPAPVPEPTPPAVAEPEPAPAAGPPPASPDPPAVDDLASTIPEPQPDAGADSGIRSFYSVAPLLAGGSIPEEHGWSLLVDRGYRTVLDLRPVDEVRPGDFAASNALGLRHILLPMTPGRIDSALVSRFEEELAIDSSRPVFFCDRDGSAAAALWYVHRVSVDHADPDRARRDAERIAPIPADLLLAAQSFLDGRPVATSASSSSAIDDPAALASTEPVLELSPTEPSPNGADHAAGSEVVPALDVADSTPTNTDETPDDPAEITVAEVFDDPFAKPKAPPVDPKGWGPYAAFFLVILAVPLAFYGVGSLPVGRLRTTIRASLPGPGRPPESALPSSDA